MPQLTPKLASLYRIFLRATSTSVLHKDQATKNLRRLYRPAFEAAAKTARSLETSKAVNTQSIEKKKWLEEFDNRGEYCSLPFIGILLIFPVM